MDRPQVLSDGMLGFQQACKLEDTPLPFPYAQMVSLVLIIFAVTYPLMAASKASGDRPLFDAPWLACAMTFICVLCYFSLHEGAPLGLTAGTGLRWLAAQPSSRLPPVSSRAQRRGL